MRIDHIAIWTPDLERLRNFYQKYFELQCNDKYKNKSKGFSSYFLSFEKGARIEIMHRHNCKESNESQALNYGFTHMAFSIGGKNKVDCLTEKLRSDGFQVVGEPRTTGDGYYESVVLDPDGNQIEITE